MPRRATATSFGGTRGNTPKPSHSHIGADVRLIRQRYREAASRQLHRLEEIAAGTLAIPVLDDDGKSLKDADGKVIKRKPNLDHQLRAMEQLGKYGIGTREEIAGDPNQPLEVTVKFVHEQRR